MADISVLTTTRYVRPGAYIGRIIRPDPTTTSFIRIPCFVGRGSRLQTLFDKAIRRSYIKAASLTFSNVAPNLAPLTYAASNDQTIAVLYDSNKKPVPVSQWTFVESVPGSKVYDQVLIKPSAFSINTTYFINYQSTSRLYKDPLPQITDLRLVRAVGDAEGQSLYAEGSNFIIDNTIGAVAAGTSNAHTVAGFTPVSKVKGVVSTGSVTIAAGANYVHPYNRVYTIRCKNIAGSQYTFEWESVENSGGAAMLPRVPVATPPSVAAPTFVVDVLVTNPDTISLAHHLLTNGGDLGVSVTVDPTAGGAIAVGDVWQFTALGAGLLELDSSYANTNQFSQIGTPVATLQPGSTGSVSVFDFAEFTGTSNRTYVLEVVAVAGVSPNRQATIAWQGTGDTGVTTGVVTINEATGSNLGVTLEAGVKLNFSFGAGQFVVTATPSGNVGDVFKITCLAPRRVVLAKDDRNYDLAVTGVAAGNSSTVPAPQALGLYYESHTIEGGFGLLSLEANSGLQPWAIGLTTALSAVTPDPGNLGAGVMTVSGTPTSSFAFVVRIGVGGIPGIATIEISQDGGSTFAAAVTSAAVPGSYTVPGTGIAITMTGIFASGDLYRFNSTTAGYPKPAAGSFTLPGDFVYWARNIGADTTPDLKQDRYVAADAFSFSYTDLLTVDWDLSARTIETFNSTQIFTDVLGTITGVAGRKYLVLTNAPDSIQYVHNTPSDTPLSYIALAGTPYVTFPVAPTGGVKILYTWRGLEPAPGSFYYVTVDVVRAADQYNKVIYALNPDDSKRLLGPLSPDNDLHVMADIAWENFAPRIAYVQAFDQSGSGVYSDQDYKTALTATEKSNLITDVTVLNRFSILSSALLSNEAMNDPFQRKERMLWVGVPANTAIGNPQDPGTLVYLSRVTLQVFGNNQAHGRRVLLGNTFASRTITLGDGSQTSVDMDGSFIAGAASAKNASFTDPATMLLRTNLGGFDNGLTPTVPAMQTYGEEEELELGAASILYLSNQGTLTAPVFRFEESVTVDTISSDNNEISAQNQQFYVTRDIRSRMDTAMIGFVPASQQAGVAFIKNQIVTYLSEYVSRGIIADYTNDDGSSRTIDPSQDVIVTRDKTSPTNYYVLFWYSVRYGIKRVLGAYSVDKRVFGTVNG